MTTHKRTTIPRAATGDLHTIVSQALTNLIQNCDNRSFLHILHDGTIWIPVETLLGGTFQLGDLKILGKKQKRSTFDASRGLWLIADFEGFENLFVLDTEIEDLKGQVELLSFGFDRDVLPREELAAELVATIEPMLNFFLPHFHKCKQKSTAFDYWSAETPREFALWVANGWAN